MMENIITTAEREYLEYFGIDIDDINHRKEKLIPKVTNTTAPFDTPEILLLNENERKQFIKKTMRSYINIGMKGAFKKQYSMLEKRDEYKGTIFIQSNNPLLLRFIQRDNMKTPKLKGIIEPESVDWDSYTITADLYYFPVENIDTDKIREKEKFKKMLFDDIITIEKSYTDVMQKMFQYVSNDYNYIVNQEIMSKIDTVKIKHPKSYINIKGTHSTLKLDLSLYINRYITFESNGIKYQCDVLILIQLFPNALSNFLIKEFSLHSVNDLEDHLKIKIKKIVQKNMKKMMPTINRYTGPSKYKRVYHTDIFGIKGHYTIQTPIPDKDNYKDIIDIFNPDVISKDINGIIASISHNVQQVYYKTIQDSLKLIPQRLRKRNTNIAIDLY